MPPVRAKRLYLDTSVVSALFDERTIERQNMTIDFWRKLKGHSKFVSSIVLDEIAAAPEPLRQSFAERIKDFDVLPMSTEAEELAQRYIEQNIFSERYLSDAIHVAIATIHRMDYLVSWNFAHLVKVRTRQAVNLVNSLTGYPTIEIIAPPEF